MLIYIFIIIFLDNRNPHKVFSSLEITCIVYKHLTKVLIMSWANTIAGIRSTFLQTQSGTVAGFLHIFLPVCIGRSAIWCTAFLTKPVLFLFGFVSVFDLFSFSFTSVWLIWVLSLHPWFQYHLRTLYIHHCC